MVDVDVLVDVEVIVLVDVFVLVLVTVDVLVLVLVDELVRVFAVPKKQLMYTLPFALKVLHFFLARRYFASIWF